MKPVMSNESIDHLKVVPWAKSGSARTHSERYRSGETGSDSYSTRIQIPTDHDNIQHPHSKSSTIKYKP